MRNCSYLTCNFNNEKMNFQQKIFLPLPAVNSSYGKQHIVYYPSNWTRDSTASTLTNTRSSPSRFLAPRFMASRFLAPRFSACKPSFYKKKKTSSGNEYVTVSNRIRINGLVPSVSQGDLHEEFSVHGPIAAIKIVRNKYDLDGYAFITFFKVEDANLAMSGASVRHLNGSVIYVHPAVQKRKHVNYRITPINRRYLMNTMLEINDKYKAMFVDLEDDARKPPVYPLIKQIDLNIPHHLKRSTKTDPQNDTPSSHSEHSEDDMPLSNCMVSLISELPTSSLSSKVSVTHKIETLSGEAFSVYSEEVFDDRQRITADTTSTITNLRENISESYNEFTGETYTKSQFYLDLQQYNPVSDFTYVDNLNCDNGEEPSSIRLNNHSDNPTAYSEYYHNAHSTTFVLAQCDSASSNIQGNNESTNYQPVPISLQTPHNTTPQNSHVNMEPDPQEESHFFDESQTSEELCEFDNSDICQQPSLNEKPHRYDKPQLYEAQRTHQRSFLYQTPQAYPLRYTYQQPYTYAQMYQPINIYHAPVFRSTSNQYQGVQVYQPQPILQNTSIYQHRQVYPLVPVYQPSLQIYQPSWFYQVPQFNPNMQMIQVSTIYPRPIYQNLLVPQVCSIYQETDMYGEPCINENQVLQMIDNPPLHEEPRVLKGKKKLHRCEVLSTHKELKLYNASDTNDDLKLQDDLQVCGLPLVTEESQVNKEKEMRNSQSCKKLKKYTTPSTFENPQVPILNLENFDVYKKCSIVLSTFPDVPVISTLYKYGINNEHREGPTITEISHSDSIQEVAAVEAVSKVKLIQKINSDEAILLQNKENENIVAPFQEVENVLLQDDINTSSQQKSSDSTQHDVGTSFENIACALSQHDQSHLSPLNVVNQMEDNNYAIGGVEYLDIYNFQKHADDFVSYIQKLESFEEQFSDSPFQFLQPEEFDEVLSSSRRDCYSGDDLSLSDSDDGITVEIEQFKDYDKYLKISQNITEESTKPPILEHEVDLENIEIKESITTTPATPIVFPDTEKCIKAQIIEDKLNLRNEKALDLVKTVITNEPATLIALPKSRVCFEPIVPLVTIITHKADEVSSDSSESVASYKPVVPIAEIGPTITLLKPVTPVVSEPAIQFKYPKSVLLTTSESCAVVEPQKEVKSTSKSSKNRLLISRRAKQRLAKAKTAAKVEPIAEAAAKEEQTTKKELKAKAAVKEEPKAIEKPETDKTILRPDDCCVRMTNCATQIPETGTMANRDRFINNDYKPVLRTVETQTMSTPKDEDGESKALCFTYADATKATK